MPRLQRECYFERMFARLYPCIRCVVQGRLFRVQRPAEAAGGEGAPVGEMGVQLRQRTVRHAHLVCRPDRRGLASVSIDHCTKNRLSCYVQVCI